MKLEEIAHKVGGKLKGDGQVEILGVGALDQAGPDQITFLASSKFRPYLKSTKAGAVILSENEAIENPRASIVHPNPHYAFALAVGLFHPQGVEKPAGIHPASAVDPSARIGKGVYLGPFCIVEGQVEIKENCTIMAGCFVGSGSKLDQGVSLHPGVTIYSNSIIGRQVIIHAGSVIGSDGFGYAFEQGKFHKIPQIGNVVIEDDVEIGANCTIDRGALGSTRIGRGSKLDNLVHLGHNVEIGENSILVAQVGIGGSTKLGQYVTLAGQAGLAGHITVGDKVTVGAQAGVTKSVPAGKTVSGYPAREHGEAKRIEACVSNLPEYIRRLKELETKLSKRE